MLTACPCRHLASVQGRGEVRGSMARRSCLAAALVLAVVALLAPAEAKGSKGVRATSAPRQAAQEGTAPPPRKKKRREYDYDDDDDDDDDFGGGSRQMTYYKPRRKPTGPSVLQRAQAMAKEASARGLEMSKVAASRAKDLAAEAAVKGQEASRLAKAYYSSEYEKFLLTATWPSDQRVSPQLAKRLVESVARFPARRRPDDDPYRGTLRNWKKMIERDWRTTQKLCTPRPVAVDAHQERARLRARQVHGRRRRPEDGPQVLLAAGARGAAGRRRRRARRRRRRVRRSCCGARCSSRASSRTSPRRRRRRSRPPSRSAPPTSLTRRR